MTDTRSGTWIMSLLLSSILMSVRLVFYINVICSRHYLEMYSSLPLVQDWVGTLYRLVSNFSLLISHLHPYPHHLPPHLGIDRFGSPLSRTNKFSLLTVSKPYRPYVFQRVQSLIDQRSLSLSTVDRFHPLYLYFYPSLIHSVLTPFVSVVIVLERGKRESGRSEPKRNTQTKWETSEYPNVHRVIPTGSMPGTERWRRWLGETDWKDESLGVNNGLCRSPRVKV